MAAILSMALPFFGLILLGYVTAKYKRLDVSGLAWMNFFIVYVALPALFYNLLSQTPIEKLGNFAFIFASLLGTYIAFAIAFAIGTADTGGDIRQSTIQGLSGAYGNIGYMGPGIAIGALGEPAAVPVALILCFDNTLHFAMAPLMMAMSGEGEKQSPLKLAWDVLKKIFTHPFIVATIVGVTAAALEFKAPEAAQVLLDYLQGAAAPCALFAMGVTVALAPRGNFPKVMAALVPVKLIVHPVIVYLLLSWVGDFDPVWVYAAVILASLPTATNVFVIAQQYDVWVVRASSMVLVSTIASVVTVTGLLWLIATKTLPPDLFPSV
ncbi:AEC family transporter [Ahrensia sp. R2A130]|uniref:AEC family transporter n=1 Tax=Ahrensia sp. R2A130 TaxID=744979 RepID=UPI0001E0E049|nr:AEC family transporter [Ahrensia sp. R2A130]EFL90340.1 putative malonate transporter [Ahrensia sp. R2A130]